MDFREQSSQRLRKFQNLTNSLLPFQSVHEIRIFLEGFHGLVRKDGTEALVLKIKDSFELRNVAKTVAGKNLEDTELVAESQPCAPPFSGSKAEALSDARSVFGPVERVPALVRCTVDIFDGGIAGMRMSTVTEETSSSTAFGSSLQKRSVHRVRRVGYSRSSRGSAFSPFSRSIK
jgi:hypothetical protein